MMSASHRVLLWLKALRGLGIVILVSAVLSSCNEGTSGITTLDKRAATAAATALADTIDAFAARLAAELPPEADYEEIKRFVRRIAVEPSEAARMRHVADLYSELARSAKRTLKDGRKAAHQVVESIVIVAPALALQRDTVPHDGKASREPLAGMVEMLERQMAPEAKPETEGAFVLAVLDELATVASIGLYTQTDADGRHVARERLQQLADIDPPPEDIVEEDGDLDLPSPLDSQTRERLALWLKPGRGNHLFGVAAAWVETEGGLSDLILDAVSPILFER